MTPRIVPNASGRKLRTLPLDQLMSQAAAAKELAIGRTTVKAWIATGRLDAGCDPYGIVKPTRASVERLKAQREGEAADAQPAAV